MVISVMCYEFFVRSRVNHFRFRYWFVASFFGLFQVSLGLINVFMCSDYIQSMRWLSFVVMNIALLEVFIYNAKLNRRVELVGRCVFYILVCADNLATTPVYAIGLSAILMYVAYCCNQMYFVVSFLLLAVSYIVPYATGFSTEYSLIAGTVYSLHVIYGIYSMYNRERIEDKIKSGIDY